MEVANVHRTIASYLEIIIPSKKKGREQVMKKHFVNKMTKWICRDAMKKERNKGRDDLSHDVTCHMIVT